MFCGTPFSCGQERVPPIVATEDGELVILSSVSCMFVNNFYLTSNLLFEVIPLAPSCIVVDAKRESDLRSTIEYIIPKFLDKSLHRQLNLL